VEGIRRELEELRRENELKDSEFEQKIKNHDKKVIFPY
jgi:hypothetical protein